MVQLIRFVEFSMIITAHNFHDSKHEMQWTFYKSVAQSRGMPGMRPLWSAFSAASTLNLFQNQLCFKQIPWFCAWGQNLCNVQLAHIGPHLWYIQLISGIYSIYLYDMTIKRAKEGRAITNLRKIISGPNHIFLSGGEGGVAHEDRFCAIFNWRILDHILWYIQLITGIFSIYLYNIAIKGLRMRTDFVQYSTGAYWTTAVEIALTQSDCAKLKGPPYNFNAAAH